MNPKWENYCRRSNLLLQQGTTFIWKFDKDPLTNIIIDEGNSTSLCGRGSSFSEHLPPVFISSWPANPWRQHLAASCTQFLQHWHNFKFLNIFWHLLWISPFTISAPTAIRPIGHNWNPDIAFMADASFPIEEVLLKMH